jgi:hypothetical protein
MHVNEFKKILFSTGSPSTSSGPSPVRSQLRRPLLTTRGIAISAILGAMALVTEALGLSLPGYLPGVNFNLVGTYLSIATMAAGPIGGIIVTILDSFTSSVGFYGLPFYWPHVFVLAYFWPKIYNIKNKSVRFVGYWAVTAVALFIQYWGWFWLYVVVFKYASTIWPLVYYNFLGGAYWVFLLIYALIPSIILSLFPSFVKPDWKFPRLGWITLAVVILFMALAFTKS